MYKMAKIKGIRTNIKEDSNEQEKESFKQFIITKRIAKHGSQAIIVIPRILESELRPDTIVELKINIIREAGK